MIFIFCSFSLHLKSYRNCPTALSLMICNYILVFDHYDDHSLPELFQFTLLEFVPLNVFLCVTALSVDVCGKWLLLGRRETGVYPWDQSSYCQRWQIYLTLQEIRRGERRKTGILDMIQGTQYLVWYFRALGANIGENVCLYPNGGDPMLTEPDLVTIGDGAAVDDASLIAHINTRGVFRLNPLVVGRGCVLRSMTRLLSGAVMEPHSIMLEHTLVLAGEAVDIGSVWQGWPSRSQVSLDVHRESIRRQFNSILRHNTDALKFSTSGKSPSSSDGSAKQHHHQRQDRNVSFVATQTQPRSAVTTPRAAGSSNHTSVVVVGGVGSNNTSPNRNAAGTVVRIVDDSVLGLNPERMPLLAGGGFSNSPNKDGTKKGGYNSLEMV